MPRYFTLDLPSAYEQGFINQQEDGVGLFCQDGDEVRLVGVDADVINAPEDATLERHYSWVLKELNRLAGN